MRYWAWLHQFLRSIYHISLTKAVLISLLFLLLITNYCVAALNNFFNYQKMLQNVGFKSYPLTEERFHFFLWDTLQHEVIRISRKPDLSQSPLTTFYLTLKNSDIEKLDSNLPESGKKEYVPGYLRLNHELHKIKLRYRGDGAYHWFYPQKSLRIKILDQSASVPGLKFNLVNPPQAYSPIFSPVMYKTARQLGLMAPDSFPARVYLNGAYMGVYDYLGQTDESLLQKFKRAPGSIYSGESGPPDETGVSTLWKNAENWTLETSYAHQSNPGIKPLLQAVNQFSDQQFYQFANRSLNLDKFNRYFALDVITGTSHHDFFHNHKIYFDPSSRQYEPIEWDIRHASCLPVKDLSYYPLLRRIKLNPYLEAERDRATYQAMQTLTPNYFSAEFKNMRDTVIRDLEADIYRDVAINSYISGDIISIPFNIQEFDDSLSAILGGLKLRRVYLDKLFNESTARYQVKALPQFTRVDFEINGNSGITFNFNQLGITDTHSTVRQDRNQNGKLDSRDPIISPDASENLYPGRKEIPGNALNTPSMNTYYGNNQLVNSPLRYTYFIISPKPKPNSSFIARNCITNKAVHVAQENFSLDKLPTLSIHPWSLLLTQGNLPERRHKN